MKGIQMVDLVGQHQRIEQELQDAMNRVLRTGAFVKGPEVQAFGEELAAYTGVKHVIPCANGTDALQIAMMALGIGPGDEVITTGFTFISTIEVVALMGATPVLVDVHGDTFNICAEQVEAAITPRTKAIVPVHLFGQMADMEALLDISEKHGIPIIEDNAQAIGSRWRDSKSGAQSGTLGLMGTTSFFPSKNLGCMGDGGAVMTNDDAIAETCMQIANHGMKKQYHHEIIGINSRLDGLQAAILRVKLRHLDAFIASRQAAADRYDDLLHSHPAILRPFRDGKSTHVFHQYTVQVEASLRDELKAFLGNAGVPTGVYYPIPGHAQKAFSLYKFNSENFPVSSALAKSVLSLPMHTELTGEQQAYIMDMMFKFVDSHRL